MDFVHDGYVWTLILHIKNELTDSVWHDIFHIFNYPSNVCRKGCFAELHNEGGGPNSD